jgi:hypothetical protein
LTVSEGESSAVLLGSRKNSDESTVARDESSASNDQLSPAREGFNLVLFRSKKSSYPFIANDDESTAARRRFVASDDELEESSGRLKKSIDEFVELLFRITFARDRLFASSYRIIIALFRSVASGGRSSASTRRHSDVGRRRLASREGVTTSDAESAASGSGSSFARSYPYMVTCPYCPSFWRRKGRNGDTHTGQILT